MASPKKTPSQRKVVKAKKPNFPAGRVGSLLRKGRYAKRVSATAGQYLSSVLNYITAELIEVAQKSMKRRTTRLTPRAINLGVRGDEELAELFHNVTISTGGTVGHMHSALQKMIKKAMKHRH